MAFKTASPTSSVPDSPEQLFRSLPRRRFPDVMPHQQEIMSAYISKAKEKPDVALQLPTGSGKTLVGLLIAEWRRRKYQERVVYLCPTRQLVNQTVEQASEKYGLTVLGFTGSARGYNQSNKAKYRDARSVAVTTFSSLFNTHPFFYDANVLIVDDAHAAENYIAPLWTVRIERKKEHHHGLYAVLENILRPLLDPFDFIRLAGQTNNVSDLAWVDKIPTPEFAQIAGSFREAIEQYAEEAKLTHEWSMVRDHFEGVSPLPFIERNTD